MKNYSIPKFIVWSFCVVISLTGLISAYNLYSIKSENKLILNVSKNTFSGVIGLEKDGELSFLLDEENNLEKCHIIPGVLETKLNYTELNQTGNLQGYVAIPMKVASLKCNDSTVSYINENKISLDNGIYFLIKKEEMEKFKKHYDVFLSSERLLQENNKITNVKWRNK